MSFKHFTAADLARMRAEHPDTFVVEVITAHWASLLTIPKAHAGKEVKTMPGITVDMLDNASLALSGDLLSQAA